MLVCDLPASVDVEDQERESAGSQGQRRHTGATVAPAEVDKAKDRDGNQQAYAEALERLPLCFYWLQSTGRAQANPGRKECQGGQRQSKGPQRLTGAQTLERQL